MTLILLRRKFIFPDLSSAQLIFTLLLIFSSQKEITLAQRPLISASFVFGDSLVDAGNNNYMQTLSRANYPPYGIDFPIGHSPTGRYTNGLTIPDIIGQNLGLSTFSSPYLAPTTKGFAMLQGVNYASGGGGILNQTGRNYIGRLSFATQTSLFEQTVKSLESLYGKTFVMEFMSRAILSITIGSNDFLNNFWLFLVPYRKSNGGTGSPQRIFIQNLVAIYTSQITRMYQVGARKFILVAIPPIGCTPYLLAMNIQLNKCVEQVNQWAVDFNNQIKLLVPKLHQTLIGANIVYADAYQAALDILHDYHAYGIEQTTQPCCGGQTLSCQLFTNLCTDRSKYFFWDEFHPTQVVYEMIARKILIGSTYTFPINVVQLANI